MPPSRARIALVSIPDPHSGFTIARYQGLALEKCCGSVQLFGPPNPWVRKPLNLAGRVSRRLTPNHRFLEQHSHTFGRACARVFNRELKGADADWVYAPWGSPVVPYLETDSPLVYLSDATFRILVDYYPYFSSLSARSLRTGDELERLSLARADAACFTSDWAARSAIDDYGADPAKVHVVPMGANLETPPTRETLRFDSPPGAVRLLFIGVDWLRKGGDMALDALRELRALGVDASLTVVGCEPPEGTADPRLQVIGFLDKRVDADRERLQSLLRDADFFIMPTRAECAGAVYIEAAAYAVPSLGTRTGGVASAILDGVTGLLFDYDCVGADYARAIATLVSDPARYSALRRSAREAFESHFSWEVWGSRMNRIAGSLLPAGVRTPSAAH